MKWTVSLGNFFDYFAQESNLGKTSRKLEKE
jgi:hypothetical protein